MAGIRTLSVTLAIVSGLAGVVTPGERVQAETLTAETLTIGAAPALKTALKGIVTAETLTIGAAPTLKTALKGIMPLFEKEYGATVHVVYGPSQTLRQQIEKGAPIDVFLPASVEEVENLHKKGLTINGVPRVYAQSSLVLVMSMTSPAMAISFHDVLREQGIRFAVGDPKTSALGEVTARALAKLDPAYHNRFRLLYAQHSGEILDLLHTGRADVGIIYRVDAINSGQVRIIDEAPGGTHVPVQFGEAMVWTCRNASLEIAEKFLDFLMSPRIRKLLIQHGFDAVPSNG